MANTTEESGPGTMACRENLPDGTRIGRFVVVEDIDGRRHAVAASAVGAACEAEDGDTLLLLAGSRLIRVGYRLETVLNWLDGRGPG